MRNVTNTKKERTKGTKKEDSIQTAKKVKSTKVSAAPTEARPKIKAKPTVNPVVPIVEEKVPVMVMKKDNSFITTTTNANKQVTVRYSDDDLLEFRKLIEGKIIQVDEDIKSLRSLLEGDGENKNFMEQASEEADKSTIRTTINQKNEYKAKLTNALYRIQNKTYGVCVVTKELIPKDRLRAVPVTTQTLEAKLGLTNTRARR